MPRPSGPPPSREEFEARLALLDNLPDVIWTADSEGRAVYISPRVEQTFGFTPEEVYELGEELWLGRIHPDDLEGVWDAYRGLFTHHRLFDVVYRYHHRDGRWVWIHDRALTTWERGGVRYTDGVLSDISAFKQAEADLARVQEQLHQSRKMEAIGQLAAGIAHDFNNLLTAILGYSELLLESDLPRPAQRAQAIEIHNAAVRAATLTRQIQAFSRKQVLRPSLVEVGTLIGEIEPTLRRVLGARIELTIILHEPCYIRADKERFEQVMTNLAANAKDAMPDGGRLTIEAACVPFVPPDPPGQPARQAQPHVVVSFADTGRGMDDETMRRLFEPFFTTKEVGEGTGLGLAMAYGIVKQSGGHIEVESKVGVGTTFRVYLPIVDGPPPAA